MQSFFCFFFFTLPLITLGDRLKDFIHFCDWLISIPESEPGLNYFITKNETILGQQLNFSACILMKMSERESQIS